MYSAYSTSVGVISNEEIIEKLREENQELRNKIKELENKGKRYFLVATQDGEGCDYTIACGKDYEELSSDIEDAKEETKQYIEDHGVEFDEVLILEVTKIIKKVFPKKEWDEE